MRSCDDVFGAVESRFGGADLFLMADGHDEDAPGDEVAYQQWDERHAVRDVVEFPLPIDEGEGFNEREDQGVAEAAKQREEQDDGFCDEHLERAEPRRDAEVERHVGVQLR